jgi:transcription antitermination protein NusB
LTRRQAREQALQALYSIAVGRRDPDEAISELLSADATTEHRLFVRDLVLGTLEHAEGADATIVPLLQGWSIERLATIDRLLLEMGTFELSRRPQTPPAVVISEAVELAKKFSTDDSSRFVNGVLSAVAKETAHS